MYSTCIKPVGVHLVKHRKLGVPTAWHFGVAFEFEGSSRIYIVELQGDGLQTLTLQDFALGRNVEVLRTIQHPRLIDAAVRRLNYLIYRVEAPRFNLFLQNCEHFARFVVEGKGQSKQIRKVATVGILVGAVVVWNRTKA